MTQSLSVSVFWIYSDVNFSFDFGHKTSLYGQKIINVAFSFYFYEYF